MNITDQVGELAKHYKDDNLTDFSQIFGRALTGRTSHQQDHGNDMFLY